MTDPIPDPEAIRIVKEIADKVEAALDAVLRRYEADEARSQAQTDTSTAPTEDSSASAW